MSETDTPEEREPRPAGRSFLRRPSGIPAFLVLCLGQSLSQLGSGLSAFAIGVWVYQESGEVTQLALFYLAGALPRLIALPWAGQLVDRFDRRGIMIAADTAAGLFSGLLLFLFWTDRILVWQLLIIVAFTTVLSAIQHLAFATSISSMVPKSFLGRANGLVQTGNSISLLVAPLLAGAILGAVGVHGVLLIDLVTLCLAIAAFLAVRTPKMIDAESAEELEAQPALKKAFAGLRFIRQRPGLLLLLGLFACVNLAAGMVQTLFTPLVLGFGSEATLGVVLTVVSSGMLFGGLTMSAWGGPKRQVPAIVTILGLQGLVLLLGGIWPHAVPVAAAGFLYMFMSPLVGGMSETLWQRKVPAAQQGKVFAMRRLMATSSIPVAYALAGPLADGIFEPLMAPEGPLAPILGPWIGVGEGRGIGLQLMALGFFIILVIAIAWRSPALRRLEDDVPDAEPSPGEDGPALEPEPEPQAAPVAAGP